MSKLDIEKNGRAQLSEAELKQLSECEAVIEKGLQTFMEVGQALNIIREAKLYTFEYRTFADYCDERWGFTAKYGHLNIRASEIVTQLLADGGNNCSQISELNMHQALALGQVEPERRAQVLNKAALHGPITANSILKAAGKKPDFSAYTSAIPKKPEHQSTLPMAIPFREVQKPDLLEATVTELVVRRHAVWADKFRKFPQTIIREIVTAIRGVQA